MNGNVKKKTVFLLSETNFILDLTFEQSPECERLFLLTREYKIPVVIPEYSFAEAEGNIAKTLQHRLIGIETAISILKQSARSAYHDVAALITQLHDFKARSELTDFDFPSLHDELAALSVELLFSAGDCIRRIRELLDIE